MSKYGINVPKGVAVSSGDEVKKAIQDVFPNQSEVNGSYAMSINPECLGHAFFLYSLLYTSHFLQGNYL